MGGALEEINGGASGLQSFLSKNKAASVVCFSATWCGPCKASKPQLEEMADSFAGKGVAFGIIYEHMLGDDIHMFKIRAFPTYVLFKSTSEVDRVEGVNMNGIKAMIEKAGVSGGASAMTGVGHSLGGGEASSATLSPADARAQRLARFGGTGTVTAPAAPDTEDVEMKDTKPAAKEEPKKDDDDDDVEKKPTAKDGDGDATMKDATEEGEEERPKMIDPTIGLDPEILKQLTEGMGFSMIRAQKGLILGNGKTVESAVEWIMQHQDDLDIDDDIPLQPAVKAQSYKCNECGKILSNMANLELHANKTGHSDFEESTERVKPLTAEEKAAKIQEIKALLASKRAEREEAEKADNVDREKARRFMGKEMAKTREQMEVEKRKRDAALRKKQKQEYARERQRIRAELAKDKAERMANKGKLSSKLGVDGYNPDGIQYELDADGTPTEAGKEDAVASSKKPKTAVHASAAKIDDYLTKVSSYRAGGDGGKCLKILNIYLKNVVEHPEDPKFRTINTENKAFKTKVKPFVGAKNILLAVGFSPSESGSLVMDDDKYSAPLVASTKAKVQAALDAYNK